MNAVREISDTYILNARKVRYFGYSDLTTEQALAWCLPKHPHPLNQIKTGCRWCDVERLCFEVEHPATQACEALWWKKLVEQVSAEKAGCLLEWGGFAFSFVRIVHPDGRWWVSLVVDTDNAADFTGLSLEAFDKVKG